MMKALDSQHQWRLTAAVHAVAIDEDLVFLDVKRDAYTCLPDGRSLATIAADGRSIVAADDDIAADLQLAGLIERGRAHRADPLTTWVRPTCCAIRDEYGRASWRDVGRITWALKVQATGYQQRSFAEIISNALVRRHAPAATSSELLEAVDDFHRWIPYAPVSGKCLLRSFLLLMFLRRRGLDANWVFGVRLWPFYAHCWLQCGELALDEQP